MATKKATKKSAKQAAKKTTRKATAKKATAKKATARKATAKKATTRKAAAKKVVAKKPAARKTASKKAATRKAPAKKAITPRKALGNTRKLLDAKRRQAREVPPWQQIGSAPGAPGHEGYQSPEAMAKANDLHAGESRMQAIHGSMGSQDRHDQGRRDNKR